MSKKKKYIRKLAERLWIHNNTFKEIAFADAEKFCAYAEANGYIQFDPEPKPDPETKQEPAPEEMEIPWTTMNFSLPNTGGKHEQVETENNFKTATMDERPEDGQRIEIRTKNCNVFCDYKNGYIYKDGFKYRSWDVYVEGGWEWRYA